MRAVHQGYCQVLQRRTSGTLLATEAQLDTALVSVMLVNMDASSMSKDLTSDDVQINVKVCKPNID